MNKEKLKSWWNALSIDWKKTLYSNWKRASYSKDIALFTMLEDLYAFDGMPTEEVVNNLNDATILEISKIKQLHISESDEVAKINNLKPLSYLRQLEILRIIEVFEDLSPLYNLKLKLFSFFSGEMPYSAINIDKELIKGEPYDSALSSLKLNIPNCNIQAQREDYFAYYYGDWGELFDGGGYSKDTNFKGILKKLTTINKEIGDAFQTKVRHYVLQEHTLIVVRNYYDYFFNSFDIIDTYLFMIFLFLHDIGKPKAFINGDMSKQHIESINIIESIWDKLPFNQNELKIVVKLLERDTLGDFFQGRISSKKSSSNIVELSKECDLSPQVFFKLLMIYYQCDVAAYTADAGGLKFLEHLFEYKNGKKVFDEEEGLIRFSPKYWKMYLELKKEIELCQ